MTQIDTYIAFDVDRIKDFIFAGSRPRDLAGASALIRELDSIREGPYLTGFPDARVIYSAGGGGLIRIPDPDRAQQLGRHLEVEFRRRARNGSLTAVCHPAPVTGDAEGFRAARLALGAKLRIAKSRKATSEWPEAIITPDLARCSSCGIYPAAHNDVRQLEPGVDSERLCECCHERRNEARIAERQTGMALSMDDFGGRYIAVLNIDVNSAGDLFLECDSEQDTAELSRHLSEVLSAGRKHTADTFGDRYQSPLVGGDDLVLFLPVNGAPGAALEASRQLLTRLRAPHGNMNSGLSKKLHQGTLGIGMLVADAHVPLRFLFDMSTHLVDSAKAHSKRNRHTAYDKEEVLSGSAIDFWVLKGGSPIVGGAEHRKRDRYITAVRQGSMFPVDGGFKRVERIHRSRRPYLLPEFEQLVEEADMVSGAGLRSQLRGIASAWVTDTPMEAMIFTQYQLARDPSLEPFVRPRFDVDDDGKPIVAVPIADLLDIIEIERLARSQDRE